MDDPAPGRGPRALHLLLAWVCILGVVAGLVVLGQAERAARPVVEPGPAPERLDEQLLGAQTAIGLRALGQEAAVDAGDVLDQQQELVDDEPRRAWRVAVLAGELQGEAAARERLAAIETAGEGEVATDVAVLFQVYLEGVDAVAPEQRQRLVQRHGWFGELALTHGLDPDAPARAAVLATAVRAAIVLSVLSLGLIALLVGGVICAVLAWRRWRRGELVPAYRPDPAAGPVYASGFALYLLAFVGFSVVAALLASLLPEGAAIWIHWAFVPLLAVVLIVWLRLCGVVRAEAIGALGLHPGRGLWREVGAGLFGYLAGIPLVVCGFWLSTRLGAERSGMEHPVVDQIVAGGPAAILAALLLASIFAPLVEETTFRGLLYHHLRTWYGPPLAALIQGLLFAVVHPQGVAAVPVLAALGMVFAFIREWRGSLIAPMAAHAVHNAATLTIAILLLR